MTFPQNGAVIGGATRPAAARLPDCGAARLCACTAVRLRVREMGVVLLWGERDPWIRPAAADKIQALFPAAKRVNVDGGHCPHDEASGACNAAIRDFLLGA